MLFRLSINRITGGFGIAPFRPGASEFHGSLTIANNVLKATTKVTHGAWRPIVTTAMRLVYIRPFLVPNALESRTPLLAYSKTRPRGPYYRSGLQLCGRSRIRTYNLLINSQVRYHCAILPKLQVRKRNTLRFSNSL